MRKYDSVEVQGAVRERILEAFHQQIAAWNLKMPIAETLVLDFGLGKFAEIGETEVWIANDPTTGYCGKFLYVMDGQTCPHHRHVKKHETFFVVKGTMRMRMGEDEIIMHEGDVMPMPPGVAHSFTGIGPCLALEVSQPSILRDNFFDDIAIGDEGVI
jgi:mannose-6-phosphate isomerase-like protein (cupin superfamily)